MDKVGKTARQVSKKDRKQKESTMAAEKQMAKKAKRSGMKMDDIKKQAED